MYYEEKGAYTGEIAPDMLVDAGVEYVIIGHSERREYFKESDEMINKKVKKALEHQLVPILCCGESLAQREEGITLTFIKGQIEAAFADISAEDAVKVVIAYEPILEQAKLLHLNRHKKSAKLFEKISGQSMEMRQQMLFVFFMAAVSMLKMRLNCLRRKILMAVLLEEPA